ncbi:UNVERIFIED_CONTAM: hypothetical protein BEN50_11060 [Euhalothece sp. KZN 001]
MEEYTKFLQSKSKEFKGCGFTPSNLNKYLKPFQAEIDKKACQKGRFALFEECGSGKGLQELEWATQVATYTGKPVLLVCPLAVSSQFISEATKFDIAIPKRVSDQSEVFLGVNVTNYEKLHKFLPETFGGIVLDESSILKGFAGKIRKQITEFAKDIPFRLCGTATPSPNDLMEITNHAEFLGVMSAKEVLANFFIQDGNTTQKWRLRHHAHEPFYKWLASWAVAIRTPADIGFDDDGYVLPSLNRHQVTVETEVKLNQNQLFDSEAQTLSERQKIRRLTIDDRVKKAAEIVNQSNKETWIVWCDLNDESQALTKAIPDAIEVTGSMSNEAKEIALKEFTEGHHRVLVSKPSLAGFGLNWQHCHNMIFVGLSDSFEQQYQAIRRCYRFGQSKEVNVFYICAEQEGAVIRNIERKQSQHNKLMENLVKHVSAEYKPTSRDFFEVDSDVYESNDFTLYLGDSVKEIKNLSDESVGLTIFSPPFPGMYAYTNSESDIGNCKSTAELVEHFSYLIFDLYRVMQSGRNVCVHLTQEPVFKGKDGHIGLRDFRGDLIRAMERGGFHYYSEITIDKNPQLKAIRTKDHSLMFNQLAKDSAFNRVAMADYLVVFKKPGENKYPIKSGQNNGANQNGWIANDEWIRWARPVWYAQDYAPDGDGIKETDVLNVRAAKDGKDEKHLCPLQLGVIERCVKLWSNPNDVVFSPFAGIGSEGYKAIELDRKFVGIELKQSYWNTAIQNLEHISKTKNTQMNIFDVLVS